MGTHNSDDVDPTESEAAEQVGQHVDIDHLANRLEGRNGGLRTSRPDTEADSGLTQYVWRMCRFHSSADPSMPVKAHWRLQDWLDDKDIDASVSGVLDDDGKAIRTLLDGVAVTVLKELGEPADRAVKTWEGILY